MGVSPQEFRAALGRYLSLAAVKTDPQGQITAVTVSIQGVRGCRARRRSKQPVTYRVFVDVSNIRAGSLPMVWVLSPPNRSIEHVNIFSPGTCPLLKQSLPYLCWGTFGSQWSRAGAAGRTLTALLENISQHLNTPNFGSPAR